jgi:hypothetical protein
VGGSLPQHCRVAVENFTTPHPAYGCRWTCRWHQILGADSNFRIGHEWGVPSDRGTNLGCFEVYDGASLSLYEALHDPSCGDVFTHPGYGVRWCQHYRGDLPAQNRLVLRLWDVPRDCFTRQQTINGTGELHTTWDPHLRGPVRWTLVVGQPAVVHT